jgi:CubicO group peptidase (beta-lactamase class C family)
MWKSLGIAWLLLMLTGCGRAEHPARTLGIEQYPSARDLYALAEKMQAKHKLPAIGIGVIHQGRIVGLGMAGERMFGSADWATIDDAFDIASCSKSITATIAAMLVEAKTVSWDISLAAAFPELANSMHASYRGVTLEQLLRHRSGLDRLMDRNERWKDWNRRHAGKSPAEQRLLFVETALRQPPRYLPGTDEYYCNDGYLIAGSLLERAAGIEWETLVRTKLSEPLGLKSMGVGLPPKVSGHEDGWFGQTRPARIAPSDYGTPPFGSPGGFLHCSVPDLLRYLDFHNRGEYSGHALLSQTAFQYLHTPVLGQRFGLGWEIEAKRDTAGRILERSLFHGGYSGVARANMWFVPESGWGVVIVSNHGRGDGADITDIFYNVLREFRVIE